MARNSIGLSITTAFWTRSLSLAALIVVSLIEPAWGGVKKTEIVGRPTVDEDQVTVRVKVKGQDDRPVSGLQETNFQVWVKQDITQPTGQEVTPERWKSPTEAVPPPAWIIVLLDYSNSMTRTDQAGTVKLKGAVTAIRTFIDNLGQRTGNAQVAIVPFGSEPNVNCPTAQQSHPVKQEADIADRFLPVNDVKLNSHLSFLEAPPSNLSPCAATNLYGPLTTAVNYFAKKFPPVTDADAIEPEPRLSIILLSDGFHSVGNEAQGLADLKNLLNRHRNITVHTVGYGLSWAELGQKYGLGRAAEPQDLNRFPNNTDFQADYVAWDRLREIANITGGVFESSGDAQKISAALQVFLDAILGEYEITFRDPWPERGAKHAVQVGVTANGVSTPASSAAYTVSVFGRSVPFSVRMPLLVGTLVAIAGIGVLPFWLWARALKREMQ